MSVTGHGNRPTVLTLMAAACALLVVGASVGFTSSTDDAREPVRRGASPFATPAKALDVVPASSPVGSALGTSRRLYRSAPVVVVAPSADPAAQGLAARAAEQLRAPMLLDGPDTAEEIARLQARRVLAVGAVRKLSDSVAVGATSSAVDAAVESARRAHRVPSPQANDVIVLTRSVTANLAAVTTARNAGATVLPVPDADPRSAPRAAQVLRDRPRTPVIALGTPFARSLGYTLSVVRDGATQPGGGYLLFRNRHLVALYGHPGSAALGVLGEQGVTKSVRRAKVVASRYARYTDRPVVPTFELIATIASAGAGRDKDYSAEASVKTLRPWVDAARKAGMYVILDLQPGRSDFLKQAKRYRSLLREPHVGLALDPEWRLKKEQKPLQQIGSVSIGEVNRTSDWLARLTRKYRLPQKAFVLHQFSTSMIRNRSRLVTTHPELATVVHVDGQGTQGEKMGTWKAIRRGLPDGVAFGWKNFYDEDKPIRSPRKTWAVRPRPDLITYQ
ncbi:hypothetical protein [Aeromicrobium terrae]|nr:hypothetical protein [Aeromicrobium terrae]